MPLSGGAPELLLTELGNPRALAFDGSTLFSAWSYPGRLVAIQTATLQGTVLTSGDFDAAKIAVAQGFVYLADQASQQILRAPVGGGAVEPVVVLSSTPYDVHASGNDLWYATGNPGQLWHLAGSVPKMLAGLLRPNTSFAVDNARVYWAVPNLGVASLPKAP
jgi:hypothetical protein